MNEAWDEGREGMVVTAAQRGDDRAWRALYAGHFDGVYAFVLHRVSGNREVAEEVAQETWLTAARRIGDFDPALGTFGAWVRGIAFRVMANAVRSGRRAAVAREALGRELAGANGDSALGIERVEHVAVTLTALPDGYRAILEQKYRDGMTMREIAEASGRSVKAVESLLTRARDAFRKEFARFGAVTPGREEG